MLEACFVGLWVGSLLGWECCSCGFLKLCFTNVHLFYALLMVLLVVCNCSVVLLRLGDWSFEMHCSSHGNFTLPSGAATIFELHPPRYPLHPSPPLPPQLPFRLARTPVSCLKRQLPSRSTQHICLYLQKRVSGMLAMWFSEHVWNSCLIKM